jgi:hypothetical protein
MRWLQRHGIELRHSTEACVFYLTLIPLIGLIIAFNDKAGGQAGFSSGAPGGLRKSRAFRTFNGRHRFDFKRRTKQTNF